jgi:hypothetical protein
MTRAVPNNPNSTRLVPPAFTELITLWTGYGMPSSQYCV